MMNDTEASSTRPYLIRAMYEWCTDNGLTPYVAVAVDGSVKVPHEFVNNQEIVLNVSIDATSALTLGNEFIEFKARFGGVPREIVVPIERVMAIYAKESGQGMSFPLSASKVDPVGVSMTANPAGKGDASKGRSSDSKSIALTTVKNVARPNDADAPSPDPQPPKSGPQLKRVK